MISRGMLYKIWHTVGGRGVGGVKKVGDRDWLVIIIIWYSLLETDIGSCVHLRSNTVAARSRKALNSLICFSVPPLSLLDDAWSATLLMSSSKLARSAAFCSDADSSSAACPFSMARSMSCMAEDKDMWR